MRICVTRTQWFKSDGTHTEWNCCHLSDNITFKSLFIWENWCILIMSLKFNHKGPVNNNQSLIQIMVWCQTCHKLLSEPVMAYFLMHLSGFNESNHWLIFSSFFINSFLAVTSLWFHCNLIKSPLFFACKAASDRLQVLPQHRFHSTVKSLI